MNSINTVVIGGNMTKDPVHRVTQGGTEITNFSLAINDGFGDNQRTSFIEVTAFKSSATFLRDYCRKGDYVAVEGRISQDTWQDKATGANRSKVVVIANRVTAQSKSGDQQREERSAATEPTSEPMPEPQQEEMPF